MESQSRLIQVFVKKNIKNPTGSDIPSDLLTNVITVLRYEMTGRSSYKPEGSSLRPIHFHVNSLMSLKGEKYSYERSVYLNSLSCNLH